MYFIKILTMNIVSIITARGGSKGIPRKNIKPLNGKPVIAYSIESSTSNNLIENTFVTTEDAEIVEISKKFNAKIIPRPDELARDESTSVDVLLHALDYLEENYSLPDFFVLLQPTSPLRSSEDITNAIKLFNENDCNGLVSVCVQDHGAMLNLSIDEGYLKNVTDKKHFQVRRQDLPQLYSPNGAIYITTPESMRKSKTFFPEKTIPYIMPQERSVDLDSEFDFKFAEFLLNYKKP